jgi:hypothetical protein
VWTLWITEKFLAIAGKQTTIHLSQACSLWPCYHFDYPQPAPEGCIVNSIMFQEKIQHLGNDLAVVPTVASHNHMVRE